MAPPNNLSTLPYKINKKIAQWLTSFSSDPRPGSFPYISGDTFRNYADHLFDETTRFNPSKVKEKEIVFAQTDMLKEFFEEIHPKISAPYVLLSHNSDPNVGPEYFRYLDGKIIHWFAQSLLEIHPKITPIPLGLENLYFHNHGVISRFRYWAQNPPEKRTRILVSFGINTNPKERQPAFNALKDYSLVETLYPAVIAPEYLQKLSSYKFVASPPGNSLDCHRTWEAMYLRVVPIVRKSPMTEYFRSLGLPMLLIEDWNEINKLAQEDFDRIYKEEEKNFENPYLWMDGWLNLISEAQK